MFPNALTGLLALFVLRTPNNIHIIGWPKEFPYTLMTELTATGCIFRTNVIFDRCDLVVHVQSIWCMHVFRDLK